MLNNLIQTIVLASVITGLIYYSYKRGHLKINPFSIVDGWHKHGPRHFQANYTTLRGAKVFDFFLEKNQTYTLLYNIKVDQGTLRFRVSSNKYTFFEETFTADKQGVVELTTSSKLHGIILDGKRFKGKVECEFK